MSKKEEWFFRVLGVSNNVGVVDAPGFNYEYKVKCDHCGSPLLFDFAHLKRKDEIYLTCPVCDENIAEEILVKAMSEYRPLSKLKVPKTNDEIDDTAFNTMREFGAQGIINYKFVSMK